MVIMAIKNVTGDDEPILVDFNQLFGGRVQLVPVEEKKEDKKNEDVNGEVEGDSGRQE